LFCLLFSTILFVFQSVLESYNVRYSGCVAVSRHSDRSFVGRQFQRQFSAPFSALNRNHVSPTNNEAETTSSQTVPRTSSQASCSNLHHRCRSFGSPLSNFGSDFGRQLCKDNNDFEICWKSCECSFIEIHEDDGHDASLDVTRSKYSGLSSQ
jgi:hypothetical protein